MCHSPKGHWDDVNRAQRSDRAACLWHESLLGLVENFSGLEKCMKSWAKSAEKIKNEFQAEAALYNLSPRLIYAVVFTPLVVTVFLTLLSTPPFLQLHPFIWGENMLVETI
jgi:hypothetical protein